MEELDLRCAACGTENRAGSRFCDNCGTPLSAACPSCGTSNRSDARFCSSCGTALQAAATEARPEAAAERRLVSVLFSDLVGFTTFAEDRDPEAVRDLLTRYFDTATQIVQRHGGTIEKFIGDAVMAVWGTPVAHEDDAERAVRAALEVIDAVRALQPGLQARAGVLSGEAAVTLDAQNQGMVAGDLVNTAARLQGVAEAGTVLVGETTMRAAERAIAFEPIGEHSLKGKTSPVPAWRALRVVAQRGGQGRTDALEPPFVGRDEELRQLKEVLHAVGRERRPRLVSVTGPGGIGKSRLVWELEKYVDGVAEPIYWHRGRSPSYGEGITFWALGEMVRRRAGLTEDDGPERTREAIAATLDEHIADASERQRIGPALLSLLGVEEAPPGGRDVLFPAWRTFFERIAERGTTVLVFEDLQWADAGTLDLVEHILDWSRGLPIIVVTLARPELFDRRPDWGAGRKWMTALALEPLSDEAVGRLLAGLVPGLPADALAAVVGRAEGVPLYAVEMVRGLLTDGLIERVDDAYVPVGDLSRLRVPESLRLLIAARLDALDRADRVLLQDAAVLGQVFGADILAAVTGADSSNLEVQLRALVRRELLDIETDPRSPERGQYRFVQALIREVAYGTLTRRDRRTRHLAAARHYETLGDDELAGVLASHYLAAHEASEPGGEADAVATQARLALTAAAQRAAALGAHQHAIRHMEQALTIATGPRERAPLLDIAATSAAIAAVPEARQYAEAAVAAYRDLGDEAATVLATVRLCRVLLAASEIAPALEVLQGVLPAAEALGDPAVLAAVLANLSRALMRNAESVPAIEAADRALAIAEALDLEDVVAEALVNKGAALNQLGRRRESAALIGVAVELARSSGDRLLEIRALNNYGVSVVFDDPLRAHEIYRQNAALARDIGDMGIYVFNLSNFAGGKWPLGTWEEATDEILEAYEAAALVSDRIRLGVHVVLGDLLRGERMAERVEELRAVVGDRQGFEFQFPLLMTEANAAYQAGRFREAYDTSLEALELHGPNPELPASMGFRAAIASRDPELIRAAAARVSELSLTGPFMTATRHTVEGALAAIEGRTAEAASSFAAAYDMQLAMGLRYEAALVAVDAATLVPGHPDLRPRFAQARALLEHLGARPALERLDAATPETSAGRSAAAAPASAEVS